MTEAGASGISTLSSADAVSVSGEKGALAVSMSRTERIVVYDLAGRRVASFMGQDLRIPLPAGVYQVVAGKSRVKVMVK